MLIHNVPGKVLATPCGIWPRQDVRVRFSYLEEGRKKEEGELAIKEAEGLHLGLLSGREIG